MIEMAGTSNMIQAVFFMGIGLFGISIGGILSSVFGGSNTDSKAVQNAQAQAEAEKKHQELMAKQAVELAKHQAIISEGKSKGTLMYVGIGGAVFMLMMFMMLRK